jgi:hypothetical protein
MKVSFRYIVLLCSIFIYINPLLAQWSQVNTGLGSLKITAIARVGTTIYAGTADKGLFSSADNGNSWNTYSGNDTLPSLVINGIEGDVNGQAMFIYTQKGMALFQPPLKLYVPPFNATLSNKDITLYRQYSGTPSRRIVGTKNAGIFFTEDNTTFAWTEGTGIPAGTTKNISGFICQDITVLAIAGTENGAFKSTDRGNTWTDASTGLSGNALKINNMYAIFALTSNGLYANPNQLSFTGWLPAVATGDYRTCTTDLTGMVSGKYYFFGNNVGTSFNVNTFQSANIPLGGISGGIISSALLYGTNIFVGTETGGVFRAALSNLATGVNEKNELPNDFNLSQNYPNPFNPTTTISFSLPSKSHVSLKIFDALGREVSVLVSAELTAGTYSMHWNANSVPSGVYFYRLQAGSSTATKKLVLLR